MLCLVVYETKREGGASRTAKGARRNMLIHINLKTRTTKKASKESKARLFPKLERIEQDTTAVISGSKEARRAVEVPVGDVP